MFTIEDPTSVNH